MFFYYSFVKKKTNPPFFAYIYNERSFWYYLRWLSYIITKGDVSMKHYKNRRRQFLEEWEQSDISNDYIFSKVMAQPQLCLQLIKAAYPS